jgi:hypothetical protein
MMIRSLRLAALAIAFTAMMSAPLRSADDLSARLDDMVLTNAINMDKVPDDALKGKVVLVEFWGIN